MCGWSQAPPLPGPHSHPRPLPFPRPQHSVPVIYQSLPSLYSRSLKSKPGDDSDCWWASQHPHPPPPDPHSTTPSTPTPPFCWQTGPSPSRRPIACDSMRAADLRKEGSSRCVQAVTAALTNSVRTSAGKCGYLYQLKPSNSQVTKPRRSTAAAVGGAKTKELT